MRLFQGYFLISRLVFSRKYWWSIIGVTGLVFLLVPELYESSDDVFNELSEDDEKEKLRQVLQYLNHTINYKSIMGLDSLSQFCKWVDGTYGVHPT